MKLAEIVPEQAIILDLKPNNKVAVLRELVKATKRVEKELDVDEVVRILIERERLGSTGIGDGVAIPHVKVGGIKEVVAAFGRSKKGVDFDALDGKRISLFIMLLAPLDSANLHIEALARFSRMLKDQKLRGELLSATSKAMVFAVLNKADEMG